MTYRLFKTVLYQGKQKYGDKFDPSDLDPRFIPFYESQTRIKIEDPGYYVPELTGTVGITTGYKPVFLLMRRKSDIGSSHILNKRTKILAWDAGNGSRRTWIAYRK